MKRLTNVRKRTDNRYEARYSVKDSGGRQKYVSVYGATPEEADEKRTLAIAKLRETEGKELTNLPATAFLPGRVKKVQPLDEDTAMKVNEILCSYDTGEALGLLLCLWCGISYSEACALRFGDIDIVNDLLTVSRVMSVKSSSRGVIISCDERRIPIPGNIHKLYCRCDRNPNYYIMTDKIISIESTVSARYILKRLFQNEEKLQGVFIDTLQMTFIRRALEAGLSIKTISSITGITTQLIERRFRQYNNVNMDAVGYLYKKYNGDTAANTYKRMNILILGAGSHGHAIYEVIEELGIFNDIKYLDDKVTGQDIIGRCSQSDMTKWVDTYPCAVIGIGDNAIRGKLAEMLRKEGYILPKIVSSFAKVSKNARIGDGTVVLPQSTIGHAEIGELCIIASNSTVNYGAVVNRLCHADCQSVIRKNTIVEAGMYIGNGEIVG